MTPKFRAATPRAMATPFLPSHLIKFPGRTTSWELHSFPLEPEDHPIVLIIPATFPFPTGICSYFPDNVQAQEDLELWELDPQDPPGMDKHPMVSPHLLSWNSGHTWSPSVPLGSGSAGVAANSLDALSSWRSRGPRLALVRESQGIGILGGICRPSKSPGENLGCLLEFP